MKKNFKAKTFLFLVAIAGIWLQGFWGGLMTGIGCSLIIVATIGERAAKKAAARMDKAMRDIIAEGE